MSAVPQAAVSEAAQPVRIALVDDHWALRKGMELLLGRQGCVIVGATGNPEDAYELILSKRPDVALLDINLPGENGVDLAERLLARDPELSLLLYTGAEDPETLTRALDSGARGFALKAGSPTHLREAIGALAAGGTYVDPALRELAATPAPAEAAGVLSPREREVLELLATGLTGEQAAERLFLSSETVRTHVRNAMDKLGAHTRVHAVTLALQQREIRL